MRATRLFWPLLRGGPDSRFEIGSVTKTMTATLLAPLAGRGRLGLDDEIGRWIAAGPNGGLTILQVATHTSGLPALGPSRQAGRMDPGRSVGWLYV